MNTKIIATIGPATEAPDKLNALMDAGVKIVRVNFSHATFEQLKRIRKIVTDYNKKNNTQVALLQDLQGPRIRVGQLPENGIELKDGSEVKFSFHKKAPNFEIIPIDNAQLYSDMKKGEPLFLVNGLMELVVTKIQDKIIYAKVLRGGILRSRKGINIPFTNLKAGGLTPKDIKDVKFGMKVGIDYVAMSFVQTPNDVLKLKRILGSKSKVKIISKIERAIALKNIDKIIIVSDALMFARGDLGIELPVENLPIIQKNIIRHAHWHGTPVIVATQVLMSMMNSATPTRAEVSDIANAIFDGADAVMLSDETAVGAYPLDAIKMLGKVIKKSEEYILQDNFFDSLNGEGKIIKLI
ncbi:MAG: pyruvate kinase [Planctomycetes bacterium]|jgi:pyruvate kinase|nr:pyruvate kinase [Planctomycetota bacterium]